MASNHPIRYVGDPRVKIEVCVVQAFTKQINSVDTNIRFTMEDVQDYKWAFLDRAVYLKGGNLDIQITAVDSHHQLELCTTRL